VTAVKAGSETVGAFFDLDGTLLGAPSLEWRFIGYLLERDEISGGHVGRWLARFAVDFWHDPHGASLGNKRYLCGIREALADEWEQSLGPEFFCEDAVSVEIEVCATELETAPGVARIWDGWIRGVHMSGSAKLQAVTELAARYGIDLARSYAYGDSVGDVQMLEAVGYGVAVNPTRRLARVAREHGWHTFTWQKTIGENPNGAARRLAARVAR
jgi:phosphoserine phosphatase